MSLKGSRLVVHNRPVTIPARYQPLSRPARPDLTGGTRIGVLLSHGFTGSPASMVPWGDHLAEQGYAVEVPLLPGHGTRWQDMNLTGWDDWFAGVSRAFDTLVADNDVVIVGGLSMGGGMALRLAAERSDEVAGVMLVNPAVASNNKQLIAVPLVKHLIASMPGIGNDIAKPGVEEYGYDRTPLRALHSMTQGWKALRAELPQVKAPLLLWRSAQDHVVDPSSARLILSSVSSPVAEERVLADSFHVATLDHDAPQIFKESVEFIQGVTGQSL